MKSKWNLLYATIATTLILSACGTDTSSENPDGQSNGSTGAVEETDKGTTQDDTPSPETAGKTPDIMKDATLTDSDAQDYTVAVLPLYTLASEEPSKDSLFSNEDEAHFMRIETAVKEDGIYDLFVESMMATLEAASDGNTAIELTDTATIPSGEGIENATVFSIQADDGPITGIVFERDNMVVKLTIFDSPKEEHFTNFLHMGETIISNK